MLSELVAARRYRLLLNVIDGLPSDSAFGEALAMDVDAARVAQGFPPGPWRPSVREWSSEAQLLAAIHDQLINVVQVQMEKPYRAKPWPTPMTAAELLRREESRRKRARVHELFRVREET